MKSIGGLGVIICYIVLAIGLMFFMNSYMDLDLISTRIVLLIFTVFYFGIGIASIMLYWRMLSKRK